MMTRASSAKHCIVQPVNVHCWKTRFAMPNVRARLQWFGQNKHGHTHFQYWKMLAASKVKQCSRQSTISSSAATEPRGRTRHAGGSGGGNCRARGSGIAVRAAAPGATYKEDDAAGCVVELLEAAVPTAAWRLAALRRCAKAARNAMDTCGLVAKAWRLCGQSALSCGTGTCQDTSASVT